MAMRASGMEARTSSRRAAVLDGPGEQRTPDAESRVIVPDCLEIPLRQGGCVQEVPDRQASRSIAA